MRTPVISVAHKATRSPTPPAPKPESPETSRHDVGVLSERVSSKANGLENSIHAGAMKSRQYQHPLPPPPPPAAVPKTPEEGPLVSKTEAGNKHDPMSFFDAKQKEYYPPPKAMLQSKDPNAPMAKKTATLNPKAKEYAVEATDKLDMTPLLNVLGARTKTPGIPLTVEMAINEHGVDMEVEVGSLHGIRNVVFRFECVHDAAAFRLGASGVHHG